MSSDVSAEQTTAALVARYAHEFNAEFAAEHTVTSPLGVWMLLAAAAPLTTGDTRARLEAVLGCNADDATHRVDALLSDRHPAVASAFAIWSRPRFLNDRFATFSATLPSDVERGDVPSQADADRWVSERTDALIDTLPVSLTDATAAVFASALATRVTWMTPFDTAPAEQLGGPFAATIGTALLASRDHAQFLASTAAAGVVAAHAASSLDGLTVVSVLAADTVRPGAVHDAAHEVAALLAGLDTTAARISLADAELGDGPVCTITETIREGYGHPYIESYSTWMAAWSADADHDIMTAAGFAELCDGFDACLLDEYRPGVYEARQSAVASFTRTGFDAAAVTAFSALAGSARGEKNQIVHRHGDIRYNRPYAVVAVTAGPQRAASGSPSGSGATSGWAGVPVFSAWVTTVDDTAIPAM